MERLNSLGEVKVIVIIIALTAVTYLALINADPLPDIMESRNLVSARECVEDGNCFATTMNGVARVRKPPLPTWVAAGVMTLSGETQDVYITRLPVLVLIALTALFAFLTARIWMCRAQAFICALVTVTFFVMCDESRRITWDIFAVSFAYGGVWATLKAMERKGRDAWVALACVLWTLSVLSKGPLTLYNVMLPMLVALILTRGARAYRWWPPFVAVVLAVSVSAGWLYYVYHISAHPEVSARLGSEVSRWTTFGEEGPLFYILRLPLLIFPWTLFFIATVFYYFGKSSWGDNPARGEERERLRFFLIWFALALILLSIAPQKKARYLMGALMPVALAIALFAGRLRSSDSLKLPRFMRLLITLQLAQGPVVAVLLAGLVLYAVVALGSPLYLLISLLPIGALFYYAVRGGDTPAGRAVSVSIALVVLLSLTMSPATRDYLSRDPRFELPSALRVKDITAGSPLYIFKDDIRLVWITGRKNIALNETTVIDKLPVYMLVGARDMADFEKWRIVRHLQSKEVFSFRYNQVYRLLSLESG